jgi:hypothetical protein
MNKGVYERAVDDILSAERHLRSLAEEDIRGYRALLLEVAHIFAGEKIEAVRKHDPNAPDQWKAEEWGRFFRGMRYEVGGWANPEILEKRLASYEHKLDFERGKNDELRGKLKERLVQATEQEVKEKDLTPAERARAALWPVFPESPPAEFAKKFNTKVQWMRIALMIYLLGVKGWSARVEIATYLARAANVTVGGGGTKNFIGQMLDEGFAEQTMYGLELHTNVNFGVFRLLPDGVKICRYLGHEPVESELEYLFRRHNGRAQKEHTIAMLCFAFHARLRGWDVKLVPEMEGTDARPDMLVQHDDMKYYVEVEFGHNKEKKQKWSNQAELQGLVVFCTATPDQRKNLAHHISEKGYQGIGTDLGSLIAAQVKGDPGPLFLQSW